MLVLSLMLKIKARLIHRFECFFCARPAMIITMYVMLTMMVMLTPKTITTILITVFAQICLEFCEMLISSESVSALGKGILSFVFTHKYSHQDSVGRFFSTLNSNNSLGW